MKRVGDTIYLESVKDLKIWQFGQDLDRMARRIKSRNGVDEKVRIEIKIGEPREGVVDTWVYEI